MTVKEAAERLRLSVWSVYDLVRDGTIPHRRLGPRGGKIELDEADVVAYWDGSRREGAAEPAGGLRHFSP